MRVTARTIEGFLAAALCLFVVGILLSNRGDRTSTSESLCAPHARRDQEARARQAARPERRPPPATSTEEALERIVASEELILAYTKQLSGLDNSVLDLHLPIPTSRGLFQEEISVVDITSAPACLVATGHTGLPLRVRLWEIDTEARPFYAEGLDLWRPWLAEVDYIEHAKFKLTKGEFTSAAHDTWEGDLGFWGLALTKTGAWQGVKSLQTIRLRKFPPLEGRSEPHWAISEWRTVYFETTESEHRLFREVLDDAVADAAARQRARTSIHEKLVVNYITTGQKPDPIFEVTGWDRHPGVAVADIDRDGFDDVYVMARRGKNQLFRNRGDGTFEEIAGQVGLDQEAHTSSAIFADFDNDGDLDAFLGRTLARSVLLINEGGKFVDRSSSNVTTPLPYFASSVSAADYDGDGLLDLYVSTYAGQLIHDARVNKKFDLSYLTTRLRDEDADALVSRLDDADVHVWMNRPGPPNVLLRNVGSGHFVEARVSEPLFLFRNTYQATWGDYDGDGDPDLYCANDLAPDNLFRNDGDGGFVDVTETAGLTLMGFAMGASWGDYDGDGRQDLYVTNMYSKAGSRITAQIAGLDGRIPEMAQGNRLYRNTGHGFDKVSGPGEGAFEVEAAGWGWGSQFVDADNDGRLDLYALSGFYTAPDEIALPQDW